MKQIKTWSYFIIFILTGLCYLIFVDQWQVYKEMFGDIKEYFVGLPEDIEIPDMEEIGQKWDSFWNNLPHVSLDPMKITVSGNTVSSNIVIIETASGDQIYYVTGKDDTNPTPKPQGTVVEPIQPIQTEEPAAPTFGKVDENYFADAVFIGDSRTVGLCEYTDLKQTATFYASTGLSVYSVFSSKCIELPGQKQKVTVETALAEKQFKKVYIMLGINELGTGNVRTFVAKYKTVLERIQELQPDAMICIQSIMKVTSKRSEQGDAITNETIDARNEGLKELAEEMGLYYLDINPAITDEKGAMNSEYTHDGVHMKAQYVSLWKDYLLENGMIGE